MATLIKSNGEEMNVLPKNKRDFSLEELQKFIGGFIEIARTKNGKPMIINEEGKINDLPINQKATAIYPYNEYDFIIGDVLICQEDEIL